MSSRTVPRSVYSLSSANSGPQNGEKFPVQVLNERSWDDERDFWPAFEHDGSHSGDSDFDSEELSESEDEGEVDGATRSQGIPIDRSRSTSRYFGTTGSATANTHSPQANTSFSLLSQLLSSPEQREAANLSWSPTTTPFSAPEQRGFNATASGNQISRASTGPTLPLAGRTWTSNTSASMKPVTVFSRRALRPVDRLDAPPIDESTQASRSDCATTQSARPFAERPSLLSVMTVAGHTHDARLHLHQQGDNAEYWKDIVVINESSAEPLDTPPSSAQWFEPEYQAF